jgi:hypothetical protein
MSYKKWIYKYKFLQEEFQDITLQSQEYIEKFMDDFEEIEKEEDNKPPLNLEQLPPPKTKNNPGRDLYKALSKLHHPDKGGDTDEFSLISIMYQNKDTIGLYLKAEECGIDVEKYMNENLIKSFENCCELKEKEHDKIKGTLSWNWSTKTSPSDIMFMENNFKEKHNLKRKKKTT